jgi:branched-chain amino acid transport system substrate-binding protein
MKQAANLKNYRTEVLLPGININTSQTDYAPIEAMQLIHFDGKEYVSMGKVIGD